MSAVGTSTILAGATSQENLAPLPSRSLLQLSSAEHNPLEAEILETAREHDTEELLLVTPENEADRKRAGRFLISSATISAVVNGKIPTPLVGQLIVQLNELDSIFTDEERKEILALFELEAQNYMKRNKKIPLQLLFQIINLHHQMNNYAASAQTRELLYKQHGELHYLSYLINTFVRAAQMQNWELFAKSFQVFGITYTDWFLLNPSSCPLFYDECTLTFEMMDAARGHLEEVLMTTRENSLQGLLLTTLSSLSIFTKNFPKAHAFLSQLNTIDPETAKTIAMNILLQFGSPSDNEMIYQTLESFDTHMLYRTIKKMVNAGLKSSNPRILKLALDYLSKLKNKELRPQEHILVLNDQFFCHLALDQLEEALHCAQKIGPGQLTSAHYVLYQMATQKRMTGVMQDNLLKALQKDRLLMSPHILRSIARKIFSITQNQENPVKKAFEEAADSFHPLFV